jgi:hypothetical protein
VRIADISAGTGEGGETDLLLPLLNIGANLLDGDIDQFRPASSSRGFAHRLAQCFTCPTSRPTVRRIENRSIRISSNDP